jgi:hypothetical protein
VGREKGESYRKSKIKMQKAKRNSSSQGGTISPPKLKAKEDFCS